MQYTKTARLVNINFQGIHNARRRGFENGRITLSIGNLHGSQTNCEFTFWTTRRRDADARARTRARARRGRR